MYAFVLLVFSLNGEPTYWPMPVKQTEEECKLLLNEKKEVFELNPNIIDIQLKTNKVFEEYVVATYKAGNKSYVSCVKILSNN